MRRLKRCSNPECNELLDREKGFSRHTVKGKSFPHSKCKKCRSLEQQDRAIRKQNLSASSI